MEVVGVVASFIAVAELATKVSHVLSQYATTVSNARDDIERVQSHVKELETTLEQAQKLFNQGNNQLLPASSSLRETLKKCGDELEQLHTKLNADKVRRGMRRFGLRAMKWPLNKDDVAKVIVSLEQYRNNIMFSMQIDQTYVSRYSPSHTSKIAHICVETYSSASIEMSKAYLSRKSKIHRPSRNHTLQYLSQGTWTLSIVLLSKAG